MFRQFNRHPQTWLFATGAAYALIILAGGHSAVPLGLLVPYVWSILGTPEFSTGPDTMGQQLTVVALLTAAAVVFWFGSMVLTSGSQRNRLCESASVGCLVGAAGIVAVISETTVMTLLSASPFACTVVAYVRTAWRQPSRAALDVRA